jgi:hypothetical protein
VTAAAAAAATITSFGAQEAVLPPQSRTGPTSKAGTASIQSNFAATSSSWLTKLDSGVGLRHILSFAMLLLLLLLLLAGRVTAFVADITEHEGPGALSEQLPGPCVDFCSMVFVLSAVAPHKMRQVRGLTPDTHYASCGMVHGGIVTVTGTGIGSAEPSNPQRSQRLTG